MTGTIGASVMMDRAETRPNGPSKGETALAFSYLYLFRRVVVSLAIVGAVLAWAYELTGLFAAFVCVGIGELLESSYYIGVLRWRYPRDPNLRTN